MPNRCSRRRVLQACAVGIGVTTAGCSVGTGPSGANSPTESTKSPTDRTCPAQSSTFTEQPPTPGDGFPRLAVTSTSPSSADEVTTTATVTRPFTADSPAQIHTTFRNKARTERVFWFGTTVPFTPTSVQHASQSAMLQLVPESGVGTIDTNRDGEFQAVPEQPHDGCWQAEDEIVFSDERRFIRLEECGSATETFTVVAHPSNEACLPTGTYRTTSSWATSDTDGKTSTEQKSEWELALTVSAEEQ